MTLPSDVNNVNSAPPSAENARGVLMSQPMFAHSASGTFTPPALATLPDAASLLKALRRRLVPALIVGVLFAAIVGCLTWFLMPPPKISARTQLYVAPIAPHILFAEGGGINNETFLRSQAYLIKDRFVLNAVLRDNPEIAELPIIKEQPDPLQWLEKEITVTFPSPEIMHISLSGDRPEDQKKIVSAVTKTYLDNFVDKQRRGSIDRLKTLQEILSSAEARSAQKRKTLQQLQKNNNAISEEGLAILQKIALDDLRAVRRDLTKVRQELRTLQVELDIHPDWLEQTWPWYTALLNGLPGPGLPVNQVVVALLHDEAFVSLASPTARPPQLEGLIDKTPIIIKMKEQIHKQQQRMELMKARMTEPAYEKAIDREREILHSLIKAEQGQRDEIRPGILAEMRHQAMVKGVGNHVNRRERFRSLRAMELVLLAEGKQLDEDTQSIKKQAIDLAQLLRDIEQDEKLIKKANDRVQQMQVEQDAPKRISQPDKEAVLFAPDAAKQQVMVTSGAAAGALALVLLAFAWFEFQSRKVHSTEEVVHGLGLNLVGTVPDPSPRSWRPWSWNGNNNAVYSQSMLTESVDAARTQLLHIARQEKLQIVMITSALAGEGKTSLASHLAASLARSGRRTILVDSDLRNPTLHRLFERSRAPGLSELLRGEVDLATVSRDTPISNLWLISAGKADATALQALAFDTIPKLFEQLRPHYDFIVVDSCPVLPVADSLLVGQHVDAVIFSLLRQVSRLPRVYAAYQRLALLGIRMLGAVVNGTDHDLYPADYNYVASEND